ncbi:UNVERIFIED_CONTAM: hypothetical protein GTU68_039139 [Idotea baltica]|nr:hypothetical protein [Idotea baltica]
MASGSLGQGLSVAAGAALTKRLNNDDRFIFSLHGDGELQEGQNWEAIMFAAHHKLDNMIATVDYNGQQIDGPVEVVMDLGDLGAKWKAFGWEVYEMDGHNFEDISITIQKAKSARGLTLGEDGATHQILEDIGMMKMLPNMTVVVPCDYTQTKLATKAIAKIEGPCYLRFGRPKVPIFTNDEQNFEIGKAQVLVEGTDVSIIACGHLVWEAICAAEELEKAGVSAEVINMHTIKPLDEAAILATVAKTKCVVTAEEHQMNGGLGDSVAQVLARKLPAPLEMVAVNDSFGESGKPMELMAKYGIDAPHIIQAVKKVIARK